MPIIARPLPAPAVIDLLNGSSILIREIDGWLYLDAVSVNHGSAVPLRLDEHSETALLRVLELRRARRAAKQPSTR